MLSVFFKAKADNIFLWKEVWGCNGCKHRQTPFRRESIAENCSGQVSWLVASRQKPSQGQPPQWFFSARQQRVYSCATAHDLHVIPSWQSHYRTDPDNELLFQSADILYA